MADGASNSIDVTGSTLEGGFIPTLEELMDRLEKTGLEKYASQVSEVVAALKESFRVEHRPTLSRGKPPFGSGRTFDPSQRMLQEGETYTDIGQNGSETVKRYHMDKPLEVHQLEPYFSKGMFVTDFLRDQLKKEHNPSKRNVIQRLYDKAVEQEGMSFGGRDAAGKHWLSVPHSIPKQENTDRTESFLLEAIRTSSGQDKEVIKNLLKKYHRMKGSVQALEWCASELRDRGYGALSDMLYDKIAAGKYRKGVGVRVKSMAEYMADSRSTGSDDTSLYDKMFNKYISVFEDAAKAVMDAKRDAHNLDDLEKAMTIVLAADEIMMQKLLDIGEVIKGVVQ